MSRPTEAKKAIITLPPIEISGADYEKIREVTGKEDPTPNLVAWFKYWASGYANGAMFLTPGDVKQIEKTLGQSVEKPKDVVELVLKAQGRANGQFCYTIELDPCWHEPLADLARTRGVTPEQVLGEVCNMVVHNGWYSEWRAAKDFHASDADWQFAKDYTGKESPTFADVVATIKAQARG